MKRFLCCLALSVGACSGGNGSRSSGDLFVDSESGNDSNDGNSAMTAWRTLERVNRSYYAPGARIQFRRGQTFRGQLKLRGSGDPSRPITYGAYGDGDAPLLLGSVSRADEADWTSVGPGAWRSTNRFELEVGNIALGSGPALMGARRFRLEELQSEGDFFHDAKTGHVTIRASSNPAKQWAQLECGLNYSLAQVSAEGQQGIVVESLSLRHAGGYAIKIHESKNVTLRNLDIGWAGGGTKVGEQVRLGNGIEFWGSVSDALVENCRIHDIYDSGVDLQNIGRPVTQQNVTIRNNVIWNCGLASVELWLRPTGSVMRDVVFEHNTCFAAGGGWGGAQRPDRNGSHLISFWNEADASRITVRRNIFSEAHTTQILFERRPGVAGHASLWNALEFEENLWFDSDANALQLVTFVTSEADSPRIPLSEFSRYQAETGKDRGSIVKDPRFRNPSLGDFHLEPGSPARDAVTGGSTRSTDHFGNPVPQNSAIDLGAIEQ